MPGLRIVLLVVIVAVGAAAVLPLAMRLVTRQMTYPAPPVPVPPPPPPLEEIELAIGDDGPSVIGWWRAAATGTVEDPAPVVLFFHGNGENLETLRRGGIFDRFAELGVSVLAIDYPGYGRSAGRPGESANRAAGRAALAWARQRVAAAVPIVAVGWSLGAGVALDLAADAESGALHGVVALSAWTSLPDVAAAHFPGPLVRLLMKERYDNVEAATRVAVPALLVHGERDGIIPLEQGRILATAFAPPARFEAVEGAGHNDLLARPAVWREVGRFLDAIRDEARRRSEGGGGPRERAP